MTARQILSDRMEGSAEAGCTGQTCGAQRGCLGAQMLGQECALSPPPTGRDGGGIVMGRGLGLEHRTCSKGLRSCGSSPLGAVTHSSGTEPAGNVRGRVDPGLRPLPLASAFRWLTKQNRNLRIPPPSVPRRGKRGINATSH